MLVSISAQIATRTARRGVGRQLRSLDGEPFPLKRGAKLPFARQLSGPTAVALVSVLTLAAALLRLAITRGLSVDELTVVDQARLPFGAMWRQVVDASGYPPLHPVLEWVTIRLFGDGDFAVRLPSLVAGVALVPVVAWLGRELFDRRTAVVAALFAAVAPVLVWYSQEARAYALVALFATLTIVAVGRAIARGRPSDWAFYTVAAALVVWSDWFGIFVVLASELAIGAAVYDRRRAGVAVRGFVASWALSTVALTCQLVALALLAAAQAHQGLAGFSQATSVGASGVSFYTVVSNVSWALFGFHPAGVTQVLAAVWPLAMLASLVMIGRGLNRRAALLAAFAIIPLLGVLLLGVWSPGTFDVRYFVAAVPPALVLFARLVTAWPRGQSGRLLAGGAVLVVFAGALADQQLDPGNPRRYEYQQALADVRSHSAPGTVVLFEPSALRVVLARYGPGLISRPLSTRLPTRRQAASVAVVTSFTGQPRYRALRDREIGALRATRRLLAHHEYPGVEVWRFR